MHDIAFAVAPDLIAADKFGTVDRNKQPIGPPRHYGHILGLEMRYGPRPASANTRA